MSGIFENRIEAHRAELLSTVVGMDDKTINVTRHNGTEEIGHRWSRMDSAEGQADHRQPGRWGWVHLPQFFPTLRITLH